MSRREELLALAERCEEAAAGSDELDEAISCAIFPELRQVSVTASVTGPEMIWEMRGQRVRILDYSSSLDAALSLVPEGWAWMVRRSAPDDSQHPYHAAYVRRGLNDEDSTRYGVAATPEQALTAAALRARAAMEE